MKEYRARIAASREPEKVKAMLIAAYEAGYGDALARRPPNPPAGANAAMAYICGGLDAA
jgi:hypothetical protein